MTATIELNMTLGQLAAKRPASIPVFERLGLDYCCGGKRTLAQVCRESKIGAADVLEAIQKEEASSRPAPERSWADVSMSELADHIESTHHAFVRDALARLNTVLPRVVRAHGQQRPELTRLAEVVKVFSEEMHDHMIREERVLFPWLRRLERRSEIHTGPPWSVRRPIGCMVHDHDDAGRALGEMQSLTGGFAVPAGACPTYHSMLSLLEQLERDTHVHIHKENNILFPAGIRAEDAATAAKAPVPNPSPAREG